MKNLKNKNSRRRGVAIELAIGLLLIMTAMSTIILTTTMIQVNKQSQSINDLKTLVGEIEKMESDQIGIFFEQLINDQYESIVNETELPITIEELGEYIRLKETDLENELNKKYNQLIIDKKISFDVTVTMKITEKQKDEEQVVNGPDYITTTNKYNYEYEINYNLTVFKGPEETKTEVFVSSYKVSFNRSKTEKVTKQTIQRDIIENTYFYFSDFSDTKENLNVLFEIQSDTYFMFSPKDKFKVYVIVDEETSDDIKDKLFVNNSSNGYYIHKFDEDVECTFMLKYLMFGEDLTIQENYITKYFKILIKGVSSEELEPELIDEEEPLDPEETPPATEENYDIKVDNFVGIETVVDETKEVETIITYEVTDKTVEKTQWENK